jgi:hypothetical protein
VNHARGAMNVEVQIHQPVDHVLYLFFGRALLHHD